MRVLAVVYDFLSEFEFCPAFDKKFALDKSELIVDGNIIYITPGCSVADSALPHPVFSFGYFPSKFIILSDVSFETACSMWHDVIMWFVM